MSISSNAGGFDYANGTFVPGSYYDDSTKTAYTVEVDEEGNVTISGTSATSGATFTVTDVDNSLEGLNAMTNDASDAYSAAETARDTAAENYSNAMNAQVDAEIEVFPIKDSILSFISLAALLVNVIASILKGNTPFSFIK